VMVYICDGFCATVFGVRFVIVKLQPASASSMTAAKRVEKILLA